MSTVLELRAELKRLAELQRFLNAHQVGARYGISSRHWHRLVDSGRAPQPLRLGGAVRWPIVTLDEWDANGCPAVRHIVAKGGRS